MSASLVAKAAMTGQLDELTQIAEQGIVALGSPTSSIRPGSPTLWLVEELAVIEVRDYHYDPSRLPEYRIWAAEAGPWLRKRWDVDGFWVHGGEEGELFGAEPVPSPHGPANVTWVIRWSDRAQRDAAWEALWKDDAWNDLWSRHPGFDGYRQLSIRFMDEV